MIDTIFWDIDGTLMDFLKSEYESLKAALSDIGYDASDEDIKLYSQINDKCWKMLERGEIKRAEIPTLRFEEFFLKIGIETDIQKFNDSYITYLGSLFFIQDKGDEIIKSLKGRVRQYAATNGFKKPQSMKLKLSGFADIFDGIFISEEMGVAKPDREYFLKCFEKIGNVVPENTMIVGDSLTSDMLGGINAGIKCCWYNPDGKKAPDHMKIDYEIKSLKEIYDILK